MKIVNSKMMSVLIIMVVFGGFFLLNTFFSGHILNNSKAQGVAGGNANPQGQINRDQRLFSGDMTPDRILGSFTIKDVSVHFEIELSVLTEAFSIDDKNIESLRLGALHDLFEEYEYDGRDIGTSSMKLFVSLYKGMPYEIDEPIYIPEKAANILLEKRNLSDEQTEYIKSHIFLIK